MNSKWYNSKAFIIMLHGLCWILLFTLPYLLRPSFTSPRELLQQNKQNLSYLTNINHLTWIALFYVNAYIIVPQVIYKKRFGKYVLVLLAILSVLFIIDWTLFYFLINGFAFSIKIFFCFIFFQFYSYWLAVLLFAWLMTVYREIGCKKKKRTKI